MLITAAEPRKKGLTALFLDGEYAASVDTLTLAASGFSTGSQISDEQLLELQEASGINRAKEKAFYLMEYRSRSRKELEDRLTPLYGEEAASLAIERLEELGLIDDEKYAREVAEQLLFRKKLSGERAAFELSKKGIDRELAREIISELAPEPAEQIRDLLQTKFARRLSTEKGRASTVNSLRTMGFRWGDIREAMSELEIFEEEE